MPGAVSETPPPPPPVSVGVSPPPAAKLAPVGLKPKIRVAGAQPSEVSASNEATVEQTLSKKVVKDSGGPGPVVVALSLLAAAASVAFAFLLYQIYALPM
jgi:hypothetical protein